jgi:hypothetical protein
MRGCGEVLQNSTERVCHSCGSRLELYPPDESGVYAHGFLFAGLSELNIVYIYIMFNIFFVYIFFVYLYCVYLYVLIF